MTVHSPGASTFVRQALRLTQSTQRCHQTRSLCRQVLRPRLRQHVLPTIWQRGAKTRTKMSVLDLPQGALSLEPLEAIEEEPIYPTAIGQAKSNMKKFPTCVVLTRMGGFYELYFEHAEEFGPLLNLKVAQKFTVAGYVPMAGFPLFQLDRMLKILVQELSKRVAISEEYPNPRKDDPDSPSYGLLHDRRVSRIITPGTLIDEKFMDPFENNFLLSISVQDMEATDASLGLAWLDLSTGDFFVQQSTLTALNSELARIGPREIVLEESLRSHPLLAILQEDRHLITFTEKDNLRDQASWSEYLESDGPMEKFSAEEVRAGSALLSYVKEQLLGLAMKLQPPLRRSVENNMLIDSNSMRALEVKATLREGIAGGVGSLLKEIRRTITRSGARRLAIWLTSPETSVKVINERLNLVEHLLDAPKLLETIRRQLRLSHDSQRLVQKMAMGRGDADDLVALAKTIVATQAILEAIEMDLSNLEPSDVFTSLLQRLNIPVELAELITKSIDEDGLIQTHREEEAETAEVADLFKSLEQAEADVVEPKKSLPKAKPRRRMLREADRERQEPWIMKRNASALLGKLHKSLDRLYQDKQSLEADLREVTGAQTLSLKWTPALGHICHLKGKDMTITKIGRMADAKSVSSSKSTHSMHLPEWTHLGSNIEMARLRIRAEEETVLKGIRKKVILQLKPLRRNAAVLDELDIACSFAIMAGEQNWVRPILNMGTNHKIIGGRHPVVQSGLSTQGRSFVSNDCYVGEKERIWLITGPNMAGKSTFLRQNALISILAQIGSYVPADYAEIGIVDQIFSRVGSADNLFKDQSTFMVEMMETAVILKQATQRSFVIMDEVGRGTTPVDGVAIAYACMHHLYHINRSRVLFATHFHDLADMSEGLVNVGRYCTDVAEGANGSFTYIHQLRQGVNRQSHAIKVAKLAGLPENAIKIAQEVLSGT